MFFFNERKLWIRSCFCVELTVYTPLLLINTCCCVCVCLVVYSVHCSFGLCLQSKTVNSDCFNTLKRRNYWASLDNKSPGISEGSVRVWTCQGMTARDATCCPCWTFLTVTEEVVDLNLAMRCRAGEGGGLQNLIHQSGIDTCASTVLLKLTANQKFGWLCHY